MKMQKHAAKLRNVCAVCHPKLKDPSSRIEWKRSSLERFCQAARRLILGLSWSSASMVTAWLSRKARVKASVVAARTCGRSGLTHLDSSKRKKRRRRRRRRFSVTCSTILRNGYWQAGQRLEDCQKEEVSMLFGMGKDFSDSNTREMCVLSILKHPRISKEHWPG